MFPHFKTGYSENEEEPDLYIYLENSQRKFKKDSRVWLHKSSDKAKRNVAPPENLTTSEVCASDEAAHIDQRAIESMKEGSEEDEGNEDEDSLTSENVLMDKITKYREEFCDKAVESLSGSSLTCEIGNGSSFTDLTILNGNERGSEYPYLESDNEDTSEDMPPRLDCQGSLEWDNRLTEQYFDAVSSLTDGTPLRSPNMMDLSQVVDSEASGSYSASLLEYTTNRFSKQKFCDRRAYNPKSYKDRKLLNKQPTDSRKMKSSSAPTSKSVEFHSVDNSCNNRNKKHVGFCEDIMETQSYELVPEAEDRSNSCTNHCRPTLEVYPSCSDSG